jgi:hypothetical protein
LLDVVGVDRRNYARRVDERPPVEALRFPRLRLTGVGHCREQGRAQREVQDFASC